MQERDRHDDHHELDGGIAYGQKTTSEAAINSRCKENSIIVLLDSHIGRWIAAVLLVPQVRYRYNAARAWLLWVDGTA